MSEPHQAQNPNPANESSPQSSGQQAGRKKRNPIASEAECLSALSSLPKLMLLNMVTTAQANAIRGIMDTLLSHHAKPVGTVVSSSPGGNTLVDLVKANPQLADALTPLLGAEDVQAILRDPECDDGAA